MTYWMRRVRAALPWLVAGVLASGAVVLARLPAAWITPLFANATHGHVNLIEPEGSLWRGSASLMLAAGQDTGGATLLPGRIEWQTAFWPLWTGRVRMQMRQTESMRDPVTVEATRGGATVSAGSIGVPASLLTGLGAPFNTLALDGAVQLTWSPWRVIGQNAYGRLSVTLTDVSSRASLVKPLGSYRAVLQAQGASSTIELTTLKGPLLLNGQGTLSRMSSSFQGTAGATPEQRDNLAGLLNLLGRPSGPGTVALTFSR
ncbi:MAG TPA: type II secretion system protein N [Paraburkholderia sp.]|jgi:general secretion pathway protein N|nr:type II secretion system protein N [Paraburkholderia sp.]